MNASELISFTERIVIESVSPSVDGGRFAVKRLIGQAIRTEADVFMDTHDKLGVNLVWQKAGNNVWNKIPMTEIGNSRWAADLSLQTIGHYVFAIEAWRDEFLTYRDAVQKKIAAGVDIALEIEEGRIFLENLLVKPVKNTEKNHFNLSSPSMEYHRLAEIIALLKIKPFAKLNADFKVAPALQTQLLTYPQVQRVHLTILLSDFTQSIVHSISPHSFITRSQEFPLRVERPAAEFSSWYEVFPRSQSGDVHRHGTFDDVIKRLPSIRDMGFDTLYFTPIHPIGRVNRKGKNNSLTPSPTDPGSPYAIGSEEGGHDAINRQLGTLQDFQHLCEEAKTYGIEIALDFAIQCAPDHPWLKEHPEWFDWRPDGSIKYAENPPKKYQDIVNVDFYNPQAIPDLWLALCDIVLFWASKGVRTFRVDNPHTKPLPFWEWMIRKVQIDYPDTIFLSEAFTTPKMMNRLAKLGFTQSYTYFTWRNEKYEITEYLTQLLSGETPEYFRPHFFVNTPDINPYYLQKSDRGGFLVRAALAATLSGLWGISSGFEICEATAVPDKEEFLNSEKYEIRAWDWNRPGNIIKEISQLNRLRKAYPALQTYRGLQFHYAENEQVIFYSKSESIVQGQLAKYLILVAINLVPQFLQDTVLEIPLYLLGLNDDARFSVHDLMSDSHFVWQGKWQQLRLDPQHYHFVIWYIKPEEASDGQ